MKRYLFHYIPMFPKHNKNPQVFQKSKFLQKSLLSRDSFSCFPKPGTLSTDIPCPPILPVMGRSEGRMRSWHPCPKEGWKIHSSFSGTVRHNCRGLVINMMVLEVVQSNNKHIVIYFYSPWNSTTAHGLESSRTVFKISDIWSCLICFLLWSKLIKWTESYKG